jgi:hypothetical protein
MVYNLAQTIPGHEQAKPQQNSPYSQVALLLTKVDYFAYGSYLTSNVYLETMVRYSAFLLCEPNYLDRLVQ